MALVQVSVVPVGTETPSFSSYVADACRVAAGDGVRYQVNPMATVLEGDLDHAMDVVKRMHRAAIDNGAARVITHISIDERQDKPLTIDGAVSSVTSSLH